MRTEDFDYYLPESLIAQRPLEKRDSSRLLFLDRISGGISHHVFGNLPSFLRKGDRLVFNDTKVIPARVHAVKSTGANVEFLFTEKIDDLTWKAIVNPGRRLKQGSSAQIVNSPEISLYIGQVLPGGDRIVTLRCADKTMTLQKVLEEYGHIPLPHYISREDENSDRETYQTVYASKPGAIAAPTAGLHFTDSLLNELHDSGIDFSYVTLHVGIGTFRPVKVSDPREHPMHQERYTLSEQTSEEILKTKRDGGRVIAVGTTVVRVLEHCSASGALQPSCGKTELLILPSYRFKTVDGLITNFHLPKSTLLMLVCSFAGTNHVLNAYKSAVTENYRFYSYGDAMMLL
ncbi:MAG: tRNA preQ1(34) S-adenosylmethionine ribosyltransferase-isomerase QueA [Fibrobacter sp.]|nr:tRNA preQ1(34) S-adenosylmethionine ribosyltransferase-isomerase QueA [Fibrobacter sp.]